MSGLQLALPVLAILLVAVGLPILFLSRYKRCPSDRILVKYGRVGGGQSAICIHGGGTMVWPVIQDFQYMSLVPMTIGIPLTDALSLQNIRINVPSTFTIGISTDQEIMMNAAERLLGLTPKDIEHMAREIIFGQLRLTVASLSIEQINKDREMFLTAVRHNVEPELNKIGLYLINVNITDITDESEYIASIGQKAVSEAINKARVEVATQEKIGAIGQAEANKEKVVEVSANEAQAVKGQKTAEADRRIFVQQQEAQATIGEAEANREKTVRVAENVAQSEKGMKKAEADRRIYIQQQETEAITGENTAKAVMAESNAELAIRQADAMKRAEVAKRMAMIEIQKAQFEAERERLIAEELAAQEVEKKRIEIAAEAQAEKTRREAKGEADAILMKYEAEAKGIRQVLESKAVGYSSLIKSCAGDARAANTLLMIEKIEAIVTTQVEAIKNLKIDKVTVWDSGGNGHGGSSTSNFVSSLVRSLPPLQDVAQMAGVELPSYLGSMKQENQETPEHPNPPAPPKKA